MISNRELISRRRARSWFLGLAGGTAIIAAFAALAGGLPVTAAAASAPASGASWSRPRDLSVPGVPFGAMTALSCASRSDCTVVGFYKPRSGRDRLVAIRERRGAWGKGLGIAAPVPIKRAILAGPVLSCASAGNCAAGYSYAGKFPQQGASVITETNGTWGKAQQVRGSRSTISAISCPEPGDCTAALDRGYLVSEKHGTWRRAFPVPGLAALHGQFISFGLVSCPAPGNCTAAGNYDTAAAPFDRSFVVTEKHGIWGKAQPVRSSQGAELVLEALSCPSAGNCVAGGTIYPLTGSPGAFAVAESRGTWGTAKSLPGTSKSGGGGIDQLDCPAVGACAALVSFVINREAEPSVSTEKNGTWRNPQAIITAAGTVPGTDVGFLSCSAVGSCVLAGAIARHEELQAAAAAEVNGRWGPDILLPGILAADHGRESQIEAVSCPARSRCTAVGSFGTHLFVTTQR